MAGTQAIDPSTERPTWLETGCRTFCNRPHPCRPPGRQAVLLTCQCMAMFFLTPAEFRTLSSSGEAPTLTLHPTSGCHKADNCASSSPTFLIDTTLHPCWPRLRPGQRARLTATQPPVQIIIEHHQKLARRPSPLRRRSHGHVRGGKDTARDGASEHHSEMHTVSQVLTMADDDNHYCLPGSPRTPSHRSTWQACLH